MVAADRGWIVRARADRPARDRPMAEVRRPAPPEAEIRISADHLWVTLFSPEFTPGRARVEAGPRWVRLRGPDEPGTCGYVVRLPEPVDPSTMAARHANGVWDVAFERSARRR